MFLILEPFQAKFSYKLGSYKEKKIYSCLICLRIMRQGTRGQLLLIFTFSQWRRTDCGWTNGKIFYCGGPSVLWLAHINTSIIALLYKPMPLLLLAGHISNVCNSQLVMRHIKHGCERTETYQTWVWDISNESETY